MSRNIAIALLTITLLAFAPASAECKDYIALVPAAEIAETMGRSEIWVLQNYRINLWSKTSAAGKGKPVGKMNAGSHALILERSGQDYKVRSPLDKSEGWVNKVQVQRVVNQDTKTNRECK